MAAANGTGTAAMLGRVERRISWADRGRWVQLRGVSTASRLLGQCRRSRRRWRRRNLRILWRNDRLYSQIPRPFWRDLAGSGGNRRHRFVQLRCRPIGSFFTTARTNSRAVSLRDWNRLQFRRKKAFSHMRLYQDAVRVEYRQGTCFIFTWKNRVKSVSVILVWLYLPHRGQSQDNQDIFLFLHLSGFWGSTVLHLHVSHYWDWERRFLYSGRTELCRCNLDDSTDWRVLHL